MQPTRWRARIGQVSVVTLAGLAGSAGTSTAQTTLYVNQTSATSGGFGYGYGNSNWTGTTSALVAAFGAGNITVNSVDLSNLASLLTYDRLWLDQRWVGGTLSGTELANLGAFVATGRRAVFIGENDSWTTWNSQILGVVGGTYAGQSSATATPVGSHPITAGITSILLPTAGTSAGGTPLFSPAFAALWGPQSNVLTILDVNVLDDGNGSAADNVLFKANVATWLAGGATAVPEPSTYLLVATGVGLIGLIARRRVRG